MLFYQYQEWVSSWADFNEHEKSLSVFVNAREEGKRAARDVRTRPPVHRERVRSGVSVHPEQHGGEVRLRAALDDAAQSATRPRDARDVGATRDHQPAADGVHPGHGRRLKGETVGVLPRIHHALLGDLELYYHRRSTGLADPAEQPVCRGHSRRRYRHLAGRTSAVQPRRSGHRGVHPHGLQHLHRHRRRTDAARPEGGSRVRPGDTGELRLSGYGHGAARDHGVLSELLHPVEYQRIERLLGDAPVSERSLRRPLLRRLAQYGRAGGRSDDAQATYPHSRESRESVAFEARQLGTHCLRRGRLPGVDLVRDGDPVRRGLHSPAVAGP